MADITERFAALPSEARDIVLEMLDTVSRPLTRREVEDAMLARGGTTRSQRKIISKAIEHLHIIALVGPERG